MLTHQFPLERYPSAEGWTVVETGGAGGRVTTLNESLSGRGVNCTRLDKSTIGRLAYIKKTVAIAAGETFALSWYGRKTVCNTEKNIFSVGATESRMYMFANPASAVYFYIKNDSGATIANRVWVGGVAATNQISHYAIEIKRASAAGVADGEVHLYFNSTTVYHYTGIANYNIMASNDFIIGTYSSTSSISFDVDEIRFGTRAIDVLPASVTPPAPTGELPQAARTLFLFNQNNADSRTNAINDAPDDALLCPLPCSTTETLADYATFVNEVEHPLKNFLAFQPAVAAQITGIIAGLNVPGFFTDNGVSVSAVSRLADVDNAFVAGKANPLYGTSSRLTKTVLNAAGVRLSARIDATTLANCQALKTLGDASVSIPCGEKYYKQGTPSLDERYLRLSIETIADDTEISGDAIMNYSQAVTGLTFAPASTNSRLAFIDAVNDGHNRTAITQYMLLGYRAIISAAANFDYAAFARMLKAGGTIAEAFAVACEKLNSSNQLAAWPLLIGLFCDHDYYIYDSNDTLITTTSGESVEINQPLDSTETYYVKTVSQFGIKSDASDLLPVFVDASGNVNKTLAAIGQLQVIPTTGGHMRLIAYYSRTGETAYATQVEFGIVDESDVITWNYAIADIANSGIAEAITPDIFNTDDTVRIVARAISADGIIGNTSEITEGVADATQPEDVTNLTITQI